MKTIFLFIIIIITPMFTFSQTSDLEKENLNALFQTGKFNQIKLKNLGREWRDLLSDFGGYPELPYNPMSKKIEYIRIDTLNGLDKKAIYPRVKEWIAINYGSIRNVLHYEDFATGKIIAKGSFDLVKDDLLESFWGNPRDIVRFVKCYHTVAFTIKDGRIKTEFTNLEYVATIEGRLTETHYIRPTKKTYDIKELYPVTSSKEKTWVSRLSTLKNTTINIKNIQESIKRYIVESDNENNF